MDYMIDFDFHLEWARKEHLVHGNVNGFITVLCFPECKLQERLMEFKRFLATAL